MAKDKRSFVLYCDIKSTIEKLSDEHAGKLFKHILRYVNDENPQNDDFIIDIAFEPIKQSLKRDLRRWEAISQKRTALGRMGGLKSAELRSKQKQAIGSTFKQKQANPTKSKQKQANASKSKQVQASATKSKQNQPVSVSVSVSDSVSVINKKESVKKKAHTPESLKDQKIRLLERRKEIFRNLVFEFKNVYDEKMLHNFFDYWSEPNKSHSQMKWEMQQTWDLSRRLAKWESNDRIFRSVNNNKPFHATDY